MPTSSGQPVQAASRKPIGRVWLLTTAITSEFVALLSLTWMQITDVPEPGVHWKPYDDLASTLFMIPVGWAASYLLPCGWAVLAGYVWAARTNSYRPLVLAVAGAAWFGWIWPPWCMGLMGI